jgi:4-hydroxy-tetrahydrodipicolinate synthase
MTDFGRVLTAIVTPFDSRGEVDYRRAQELAEALISSGTDGLVIAGTTGESPTLTGEEKLRLFREVRDAIGTRATIVAGTCNYNPREH